MKNIKNTDINVSKKDKIIDTYNQDGFLLIPSFIDDRKMNLLIRDLSWLVKSQLETIDAHSCNFMSSFNMNSLQGLSELLIRLNELSPEKQGYVYDQVNRMPWMHQFASNDDLISYAKQLLLSENVAIHTRLNIVMSLPYESWHVAARWHQDTFYNQSNHLVAYVPLQDANSLNGSISIAPGGHVDGLLSHDNQQSDNKWIAINNEIVDSFPKVITPNLKKGDLLLFNGNLPHTAHINKSKTVRFAITIRFSNLEDEFFKNRGWVWKDLSEAGSIALQSKPLS